MKLYFIFFIVITFTSCSQDNQSKAKILNDQAMEMSLGTFDSVKINNAIKLLDSAIVIDSSYLLSYSNKVSLLFRVKKYKEGLQTLNVLSNYTENKSFIYLHKGIAYKYLGEYKKADLEFKNALEISSKLNNYQNKLMYFQLLVYFNNKQVALRELEKFFKENKISKIEYENIKEVILYLDESNVFNISTE